MQGTGGSFVTQADDKRMLEEIWSPRQVGDPPDAFSSTIFFSETGHSTPQASSTITGCTC
jgi:hypothetical protein